MTAREDSKEKRESLEARVRLTHPLVNHETGKDVTREDFGHDRKLRTGTYEIANRLEFEMTCTCGEKLKENYDLDLHDIFMANFEEQGRLKHRPNDFVERGIHCDKCGKNYGLRFRNFHFLKPKVEIRETKKLIEEKARRMWVYPNMKQLRRMCSYILSRNRLEETEISSVVINKKQRTILGGGLAKVIHSYKEDPPRFDFLYPIIDPLGFIYRCLINRKTELSLKVKGESKSRHEAGVADLKQARRLEDGRYEVLVRVYSFVPIETGKTEELSV